MPKRTHGTLAEERPDLVPELVDPAMAALPASSGKNVAWKCADPAHPAWEATVASRARGAGCPYCSGRRPVPGVDDLATTAPELADRLVDRGVAVEVGEGSGRRAQWRCPDCGHVWEAPVRRVAKAFRAGRTGCPACAGREWAPLPTVAEARPDLLAEAVEPDAVAGLTLGSGRVVEWRCAECPQPHTYKMAVRRKAAGQGCPVRAGVQVVPGVNDLATTHPKLAAELVDPSLAATLSRGSTAVVEWRCQKGHTWKAPVYSRVAGNGCPSCWGHGSSGQEQELADFVLGLDPSMEVRRNDRELLGGLELDVYVPGRGVAFEFNGVYWHSVEMGRDKLAHKRKHDLCRAAGVELVQVWDDDWVRDPGLVKAMAAAKLGLLPELGRALPGCDAKLCGTAYARDLAFGPASGREAAEFLKRHHIQGPVAASRSFCLRDADGDVRALVSLRSPRAAARAKRPEGTWEVVRYATRGHVPGGFSRLVAHAVRTLRSEGADVRELVSFSSNEVSDGGLYAACGWEPVAELAPDYRYARKEGRWRREPKEAWQRRRFRDDPALLWDEEWTEAEAARANGLVRVYDAGKVKWRKAV